ncbi:MAG: polyketide cyclase [Flavobacterium sp.]|nr:MAG: polyketide cyclase [Flavobacterium sp.]
MEQSKMITVEIMVKAPVEKIWKHWNEPESINKWCSASPDWHTVNARNDLRVGGEISSRMEAIDGSMGFDFGGVYTDVIPHEFIAYKMGDGRKVEISFREENGLTHIRESFDPESENPEEMQRGGWQAILSNFRDFTEAN